LKERTFEKKAELLDAALEEFCLKSYEEASLNTILKKAEISKGTFYYHFADKKALYLYLLESSVKAKWNFIREKLAERQEELQGDGIFQTFRLQAALGAEFAALYPGYHRLGRMFTRERGTPIYETAKALLSGDSEDILAGMIEKALAEGEIRHGFTKEFLVKVLTHLFSSFDEIFDGDEDFDLHRVLKNLDMYVDFMEKGMGKGRGSV
jgi:AcrR family transcriptional regulator